MAVYKGKKDGEIPKGAVQLTEDEALKMQLKVISEWKPQKEVWPIRYGSVILSCTSIISSTYLMRFYRKKLKLKNHGQYLMFLPGVIIPAFLSPLLFQELVTKPILLHVECPVCVQMRSAAIQTSMAIGYPLVVHSISSFMVANSRYTIRLPPFQWTSSAELWAVYKKLSSPLRKILPWHFMGQALIAFVVTELQARAFFNVQYQILNKMQ